MYLLEGTQGIQHVMDEKNGILNLPCNGGPVAFRIRNQ